MLVDSHCHLDLIERNFNLKLEDIVLEAEKDGVSTLLQISTSPKNFGTSLKITKEFNNIFCAIGTHPLYLSSKDDVITPLEELSRWLSEKKVVAIGETGFDFYRIDEEKSSKKKQYSLQAENLEIHIEAAQKYDLPIIIHTRDADDETIEFLTSRYKNKTFKGVIHCFSASKRLAFKMLDIGFYISASGIITFKNAQDICKTITNVPSNMLLVETDAPYLAPPPFRGKMNHPKYLIHTAKFLSELKKQSFQEFCAQTTSNFFTLFNKAKT